MYSNNSCLTLQNRSPQGRRVRDSLGLTDGFFVKTASPTALEGLGFKASGIFDSDFFVGFMAGFGRLLPQV